MAYVVKYTKNGKAGVSPKVFRTKEQARSAILKTIKMQKGTGSKMGNDLGYRSMRVKKV